MYALAMRRFIKWCIGISIIVLFLSVVVFIGTVAHISSYKTYHVQNPHADCAVVFGAAVYPGGVASGALYERTHTAVQLYKDGFVKCVVLSGAESAYNAHEVDVMRDIALAEGIPIKNIVFDHDGTNTRATLSHLSADTSYAFVSNDFHLARIKLLAQQQDISDFVLVPSKYRNGRYTREWLFIFREAIALWYYTVSGVFNI